LENRGSYTIQAFFQLCIETSSQLRSEGACWNHYIAIGFLENKLSVSNHYSLRYTSLIQCILSEIPVYVHTFIYSFIHMDVFFLLHPLFISSCEFLPQAICSYSFPFHLVFRATFHLLAHSQSLKTSAKC
jgi:hypothetical protein